MQPKLRATAVAAGLSLAWGGLALTIDITQLRTVAEELERAAPEEIARDASALRRRVDTYARQLAEEYYLLSAAPAPRDVWFRVETDEAQGAPLDAFGERRCGLVGGRYDVRVAEAARICVAYQRLRDAGASERRALRRVPDREDFAERACLT